MWLLCTYFVHLSIPFLNLRLNFRLKIIRMTHHIYFFINWLVFSLFIIISYIMLFVGFCLLFISLIIPIDNFTCMKYITRPKMNFLISFSLFLFEDRPQNFFWWLFFLILLFWTILTDSLIVLFKINRIMNPIALLINCTSWTSSLLSFANGWIFKRLI